MDILSLLNVATPFVLAVPTPIGSVTPILAWTVATPTAGASLRSATSAIPSESILIGNALGSAMVGSPILAMDSLPFASLRAAASLRSAAASAPLDVTTIGILLGKGRVASVPGISAMLRGTIVSIIPLSAMIPMSAGQLSDALAGSGSTTAYLAFQAGSGYLVFTV